MKTWLNALENLPQNENLPSHLGGRDIFDLSGAQSHTVLGSTEPSYNLSDRENAPLFLHCTERLFRWFSAQIRSAQATRQHPMRPRRSSPSHEFFPSDTGRPFELLPGEVHADLERDGRFRGQYSRFRTSGAGDPHEPSCYIPGRVAPWPRFVPASVKVRQQQVKQG